MKTLEKSQDKIKKICDELRKETLEPAKNEAARIIEEAEERAEGIILEAEKQAEKLIQAARVKIEQERNVFQSSLMQASKQSLELLKQAIDNQFFNSQLTQSLNEPLKNPKVIADFINAVVQAIQKEGVSADLSAIIPKTVSDKEVNQLLVKGVLEALKEKSVVLGELSGGIQVKLHDKKLTVDMTEEAMKELMSRHLRKGFRSLIFES